MPVAIKAGTFEGNPHFRWVKMFQGVRHRVTCEELGLPKELWTKEGSRSAANSWWEQKLATLNANPVKAAFERLTNVPPEELRRRIYEGDLAKQIVAAMPFSEEYAPEIVDEVIGIGPLETDDQRLLYLGQLNSNQPPTEKTVQALAKTWVTARQDEVRAGIRSADGADNLRIALSHFETFTGQIKPVTAIDAGLWQRWYVHCADMMNKEAWSSDYAKKCFGTARAFVRWLWEAEVMDSLPRNLSSKKHRFESEEKEPPTFEVAEVRKIVAAASGRHRLLVLLMLNTGATQKDISDLRKDQIDLSSGTITRRRSKTRKKKTTPKVCYKLWPETLELLRAHLAPEGERALLTKSGHPWVWKRLEGEKLKKSDNVATVFNNLKKKIGMTGSDKSLKVFRKTAATKLKSNTQYRDLRFFFLGHSARNLADKHYAAESQTLLNEATDWLRQQLLG